MRRSGATRSRHNSLMIQTWPIVSPLGLQTLKDQPVSNPGTLGIESDCPRMGESEAESNPFDLRQSLFELGFELAVVEIAVDELLFEVVEVVGEWFGRVVVDSHRTHPFS